MGLWKVRQDCRLENALKTVCLWLRQQKVESSFPPFYTYCSDGSHCRDVYRVNISLEHTAGKMVENGFTFRYHRQVLVIKFYGLKGIERLWSRETFENI